MLIRRVLLASLAAALPLGMAACGNGGEELSRTPSVSTDPAPSESPTSIPSELPTEEPSTYEPPEPSSSFDWQEGPVDVNEFTAHYGQAMRVVPHVLVTQQVEGDEQSRTIYIDNQDPTQRSSYEVMESGGFKIETVMRDGTIWTRTDEGEWENSGEYQPYGIDVDLVPELESVELTDAEQRIFTIMLAEGIEGSPEPVEATLQVDEHFRGVRMEIDLSGLASEISYDYETQLEIPEVGN